LSAVLIFSLDLVVPDHMTLMIEMSDGSFGSSLHIPERSWKKLTKCPLDPMTPFFKCITGINGDTH
jgi:hypothetical protein